MLAKTKKWVKFGLSPIAQLVKNKDFLIRTAYAGHYERRTLVENMVLYESYHGKSATGNPYALFKALQEDERFRTYTHVWCVNETEGPAVRALRAFQNVVIVKRETREYTRYLATAKFLINDTSFPNYFQKKEGQVYINTWHGVPFKTVGADVIGSAISAHANIQRNLLHTDFLVSPNAYTHETLIRSNRIEGAFSGTILETGYPRTDVTMKTDGGDMKKRLGLSPLPDKPVILYAPTWREAETRDHQAAIEAVFTEFEKLQEACGETYHILLKVHYFIYQHFKSKGYGDRCVPDWIDTNEILSCTDILITDYSSIFFDFLHTGRPILFYTYDKERYAKERGVYFDFSELPGPLCGTVEELIDAVHHLDRTNEQAAPAYQAMAERFALHDDGNASKRIIDAVFYGDRTHAIEPKKTKKNLLIWGGGFAMNGITVSLLNLLNTIDHDRYHVSLLFASKLNASTLASLKRVHPNVTVLYKVGAISYRLHEFYLHRLVMTAGLDRTWVRRLLPKKLYRRELSRITGNTPYDVAIDYCGYTPFWTLVMAHSWIPKRNVYLHSDMVEDANKQVNGVYRHKKNFRITFNLYHHFHRLVCVSKDTAETNREKLVSYGVSDRFVNVDNAIDSTRILEQSKEGRVDTYRGRPYYFVDEQIEEGVVSLKGVEAPRKGVTQFVTIGRLSPEKDQEKLIRSFHRLHQEYPDTCLYIAGGGVLKTSLRHLIDSLGLEESVILTGELNNPYGLLNQCDCFVLSSNYEGQGLVVLEALTLGKPVISTNIAGPKGILEPGYGLLVDNSVDGLYEGMKTYIENGITAKPFDANAYNQHALETFYEHVAK